MGLPVCNATDMVHWNVEPVWKGLTVHEIGWIISGSFAIIASLISFYLIFRHATHFSRPEEQTHIIRILLMIPIYALVSFGSYVWYWYAVYWQVIRDCYEAFAIASFFALLCHYIAPTLREQKQFFRRKEPEPWPWPATWLNVIIRGKMRKPRSGLTWFNIIWIGVFQYCFIRVAMTIVSTVTELTGRYCEGDLSPAFAYIWVLAIEIFAITIAMYLLIAFYVTLKVELTSHKPFLKLLSIKLVIFFSFWQSIVISFLDSKGVIKPSATISEGDIDVGLNTLLICVEMTGFSILHIFSFGWQEYTKTGLSRRTSMLSTPGGTNNIQDTTYKGGRFGLKALAHALNPWDIVKAFGRGIRWVFVGRKKRHVDSIYSKDSSDEEELGSLTIDTKIDYREGLLSKGGGDLDMPPVPNQAQTLGDGYEPYRGQVPPRRPVPGQTRNQESFDGREQYPKEYL